MEKMNTSFLRVGSKQSPVDSDFLDCQLHTADCLLLKMSNKELFNNDQPLKPQSHV
jgi:hypothetical protein